MGQGRRAAATALFLTSTKVVVLAMEDLDLIKACIETTRTFLQLSSAGLVVPLAFRAQLAGLVQIPSEAKTPTLLLVSASWLCLLLAIGFGALYQYVAIKFVERQADSRIALLDLSTGSGTPKEGGSRCLGRWG